jgi:prepilin-type N-terminal cleavage/methylation domain-containing protein
MKKGFSLIELMVVIAIIAILAAIALPLYQQFTCRAQAAESLNALKDTKSAWAAARTAFEFNDTNEYDFTSSVSGQDSVNIELPMRNWTYGFSNVTNDAVDINVSAQGTGLKTCVQGLNYTFKVVYDSAQRSVEFGVSGSSDTKLIKNHAIGG